MTTSRRIHDPADHQLAPLLQRIPLGVRMVVYAVVFLAVVLGAIPTLFYQLDVLVPALHVEVGPLRYVGWAWFGVSLALYLACSFLLMTRGKGPFTEVDPPKELVTGGPYEFTRNPVVVTLLSTMLGQAIGQSSTGILLMTVTFAIVTHLQITRGEEPLLLQRYGEPYAEYCRRVPRWIPRWPRTAKPGSAPESHSPSMAQHG